MKRSMILDEVFSVFSCWFGAKHRKVLGSIAVAMENWAFYQSLNAGLFILDDDHK